MNVSTITRGTAILLSAGMLSGTGTYGQTAETTSSPGIWYVYHDAIPDELHEGHGFWTNVMPESCGKEDRTTIIEAYGDRPHSGDSNVKITFVYPPERWCGLAVVSKEEEEGYWGASPGPGFDLRGYRRLVFSARGQNGGEVIQVRMGITGDKPYGDSAKIAFSTPRVRLESQWKPTRMNLIWIMRL